jgi:C1A family cysteine protease
MMEKRKLGWIPQKPDKRDRILKLDPVILPTAVDLRELCPMVYDQGNLGSCTANALSGNFEFDRIKQNKDYFMPSRLFIYFNERKTEHSIRRDAGAIIRDGIKSMAKQGVCSELEWPYIISQFSKRPPCKLYRNALKNQIVEYSAPAQTVDDLRACLASGFPFVFGFDVYESFWNIKSDGLMPLPKLNETIEGGHAVMCVGYDDSKQWFIIRNSWGESWGDKGYFYMPYQYMVTIHCSDFWTIKYVEQ